MFKRKENDMKKLGIGIVLILTVGLLAACGGGGGGGGGAAVAPGTVITQDNVEKISHLVLSRATIGLVYLLEIDGWFEATTRDCIDGGTVTISGSISDPPVIGDATTLAFTECNENGEITDGEISMLISDNTPDFDWTPPFTEIIDVEFTNLSVTDTELNLTSVSNGDISILLSETLAGDITIDISGISLMNEAEGTIETLTNYEFVIASNYISGDISYDLRGTMESTLIDGSVSFDSTTVFAGNVNISDNPTSGVLLLTTSIDNSKAILTVQNDGLNVLIEVDANGDDIYEISYTRLWSELEI
jgi:hypothetical protein